MAHGVINWCNFVKLYSNVLSNDNNAVEFHSKDKPIEVINECLKTLKMAYLSGFQGFLF